MASPIQPPTINEIDPLTIPERFGAFHIVTVPFKTITSPEPHQITTSILIPKGLLSASEVAPSPRPTIVRIHGGGFGTGSALCPPFFSRVSTDLAVREGAVMACPNYRLLPECSAEDQLADIADHQRWVHTHLNEILAQETQNRISVDPSRIMLFGESAGGYLALMQALSTPEEFRSVAVPYPMVDIKDPFFSEHSDEPLRGQSFPRSFWDEHVAKVRSGELPRVISSDPVLKRIPLMVAMFQQGRLRDFFPPEKQELHILDRIAAGAKFPRGGVLVWHGKEDTLVPVRGSLKLREVMRQADPEAKFELIVDDGDHGYDLARSLTDWEPQALKDGIAAWLK